MNSFSLFIQNILKFHYNSNNEKNILKYSTNVTIFGIKYNLIDIDGPQGLNEFLKHFNSVIWITYRKNFPLISKSFTCDAGFGCMQRCAQMLLAQGLQRHLYGLSYRSDISNINHINFLKLFADSPLADFSIHKMTNLGLKYGKTPGEWYGPHTVSLVLKDLLNDYNKTQNNTLSLVVIEQSTIYEDEINLLFSQKELTNTTTNTTTTNTTTQEYDPLLNPMISKWSSGLILMIPLRLGLQKIFPNYIPSLLKLLELQHSIGIIGGRPNSALYIVGTVDKIKNTDQEKHNVLYLDPHYVQLSYISTYDNTIRNPTYKEASTYHTEPKSISINELDPSLAIGFYCRSELDFLNLIHCVQADQ